MISKAGKGVIWSAIERFLTQGIQFTLSFLIARKLMPSDYGLIAMLSIFFAIAQTFIDSGFSTALIQKQERTENDKTTVFYFSLIVSLLCYFLLFISGPFISDFYSEPLLTKILRLSGLTLIINAIVTVHRSLLIISLEFKKIAYISITSVMISGSLAVWMAYSGFGVWTLVYQSLISSSLITTLTVMAKRWIPSLAFSRESFFSLFGFSSKILISRILHTIYTNLYSLIIGKFYSPYSLGLYNRASTLSNFATINYTSVIQSVAYPVECTLQNDDKKLTRTYFSYLRMAFFVISPLSMGLCSLAYPFINVVLTDKWTPCVPYLQILCFAYLLYPMMCLNYDLLNVKHRSDMSLESEIIKKVSGLLILLLTLPFGLLVMCLGLIVYEFIDIFIITRYTKRLIPELNMWRQLKEISPIIICSFIMSISLFLLQCIIPINAINLLLLIMIGGIEYVVLSYFLMKEEFTKFLSLIK